MLSCVPVKNPRSNRRVATFFFARSAKQKMNNLLNCYKFDHQGLPEAWRRALVSSQIAFVNEVVRRECDCSASSDDDTELSDLVSVSLEELMLDDSRLICFECTVSVNVMFYEVLFVCIWGFFREINAFSSSNDGDAADRHLCGVCRWKLMGHLRQLGCEIQRSAYRLDETHVVERRQRLDLSQHVKDFDDLQVLVRFKREDFSELCEQLLPNNEWIICDQSTKATREEAMLFLCMDLSRPRT